MPREGCVGEWPKCGTFREVPAPPGQPECPSGRLLTPEGAISDLSSSIHQLQQETETWHSQGQRQVLVPDPQQGQPQACRDTPELEPASIQELQMDLDFCRDISHKLLVQLQHQESTLKRQHQELVFLRQQCQAVMDKEQKDEAVQTEVTFDVAAHGHADTSYNILEKDTLLLEQLGTQEEQSQGLQHHLARLQEELGATQACEQQNLQQLNEAEETIQVLHQEVASNRKHMAELLQQVRDMTTLQAELAQAQQEKAKQEMTAAYEKQKLHWEWRKLQESQEQCKQEAHSLHERIRELKSQAQYWQKLYKDSIQALDMREGELVGCKVELAFLKEELNKVKTLHSAQALACSNSGRLHKETELLLVNISQCVNEPTHSNEKPGHKIQWEIKQTAELLGEKEDVQDTLREEDTYLMVGTDEQHCKCEQLKGNNFTLPAPHNSAGLSPPHSCPRDRKQRRTKQGLDNF